MTRLTTQEIEAIRKRAGKATEGPWLHAGGKFGEPLVTSYRDGINITEEVIYDFDAEFIANAREDIPKLLAEVERLKLESNGYRSALFKIVDGEVDSLGDAFRVSKEAIE